MYGDITLDPPSLLPIFKIFLLNQASLNSFSSPLVEHLISYPRAYLTNSRFIGSLANTRSNISAHYDISNEMFRAFLSADMTYSCGIFEKVDEDLEPDMSVLSLDPDREAFEKALEHTPFVSGYRASQELSPSSTISSASSPVSGSLVTSPSMAASSISTTPSSHDLRTLSDPLYDAQMRKLRHIIRKADIRAGDRVLEIGTGEYFRIL